MKHLLQKPAREIVQPIAELAELGGQPLEGSGFENETPDPEFSETKPVAPESRMVKNLKRFEKAWFPVP